MKKYIYLIALCSAAVVMALTATGSTRGLENLTLDLRFRLFPDTASASRDIVIIAVDDASMESLDWLGWPWPRQIWSDMTAFLFSQGAEVVYFDITFSTSSTFSATEDSVFGQVALLGKTVFITGLGREEGQVIPANAVLDIDLPSGSGDYMYAAPPVSDIAAGAALLAAPYAFPDADGIFRKTPVLFPAAEGAVPSPALALAMLFLGDMNASYTDKALLFNGRRIPLTDDYQMQIRFAGPTGTYRSLGVSDVFAAMTGDSASLESLDLAGKIVLIGYTASDLMDLKPMPYSPRCPGVEVIANATDNIISNRYLRVHGGAVTILLILLMALGTATALVFIPRVIPATLSGLAFILAFGAVSLALFKYSDLWLATVPPLFSGFLTLLAGSVVAYQFATKEKRFLKAAFSQYLSPEVVSLVAAHPEMLKLGGEKRIMTAFFSDVAGFTTISENLDPRDLVKLLNIYLTEMTDIILGSGGTVDKFEGDAIIAFWGAPIEYADHAERGVRAALACIERHKDLNIRLKAQGFPELHTRIGLASGPMVVGNMGSEKRFDYTMMGSDVNLASRLEGVNKVYGTELLISDVTRKDLPPDIQCREIDTIMVVGQNNPVTIWQPCILKNTVHINYEKALDLYRQGNFAAALEVFMSCHNDPPASVMADRCKSFMEGGTPVNWNGTWVLSSK